MSDEVEVVIIATGFSGNEQIANPAVSSMQRASALSEKIDRNFGVNSAQPQAEQPIPPYTYQPNSYAGTHVQTPAPDYAPTAPIPPQNGYYPPAQPQGATVNTQPVAFEPDDPIPDAEAQEPQTDKKHRPRFVDFFMKKNKDK